jgi:hypothetical protein
MYAVQKGEVRSLDQARDFEVSYLRKGVLEGSSPDEISTYREEMEAFQVEMGIASAQLRSAGKKIQAMKKACFVLDSDAAVLREKVYEAEKEYLALNREINGNPAKAEIGEKEPATPGTRMMVAYRGLSTQYGPTGLHRESLAMGREQLEPLKERLDILTGEKLPALAEELRQAGAPIIDN